MLPLLLLLKLVSTMNSDQTEKQSKSSRHHAKLVINTTTKNMDNDNNDINNTIYQYEYEKNSTKQLINLTEAERELIEVRHMGETQCHQCIEDTRLNFRKDWRSG